jgi:predicted phage terminase large subunit-like protein
MLLGSIVQELETNERIIKDFGKQAGYLPTSTKEKRQWSSRDIVTLSDIRVSARSWNSRIRGIKHGEQRPDLIILDDVENDENVVSDDQREKVKNMFFKTIMNLGTHNTQIIVVGTILHFDSLLYNLINKPIEGWYVQLYKAIKDDGTPLWKEWWTLELLDAKRKDIGSIAFEQEYMNNPLDPDSQIIKPVSYYEQVDLSFLECYGYIDLAISEKETADYTAITTIGKHKVSGKLYVLEPVRMRGDITKQLALLFAMHKKYKYVKFGVESVAYQKAFFQLVQRESLEKNIYVPVVEIEVDKDKIRRAIEVTPHIENGTVLFNAGHQDFMAELVQFPKGAHDDWVDSFVGAVNIALGGGGGVKTRKSGMTDSRKKRGGFSYPKNY